MTEARLARDYDIRFGHGLLKAESAKWGRYVVITTPSAWEATKDELDHEPAGIGINVWLDRTHLIEVSDSLPDDIDLVVGMGAGRALDHAKLVADRKGKPLVQVPTVVSTGAIIHGFVADWDGRKIIGQLTVVNCEYVLVDYDVVLRAPERLNTAGLGDVLCGYAGLSEWRRAAALGKTGPVEDAKTENALALYDHIVTEFPKTLDENGELTPASVKEIMNAVQARDDALVKDDRAPGADHAFCFVVEIAADKYWIHGEMCALGAVIIAWRTEQNPETLIGWLDKCKVRWRPRDVEITREELGAGIAVWPEWMGDGTGDKPASPSIVVQEPMTEEVIDACWEWLNSN
jgi:glycerol dehydrogenase-like iron-containing ADH family enzyme